MEKGQAITIPPKSASAFELEAGDIVRITDIEGAQPGDLVAFSRENHAVKMSQARTRVENGKVRIDEDDAIWSNTQPPEPMLAIVRNTGWSHDLLFTPCCRYALRKRFGVSEDGCLENLLRALAPWGIVEADIPDPLSLFFHVPVDSNGHMRIAPPASPPGACIELRAEMPCLIAVSTCPVPHGDRTFTEYLVERL